MEGKEERGGRNAALWDMRPSPFPVGRHEEPNVTESVSTEKAYTPGDTVQLRHEGCREWLGGQGREKGFLGFFWSQTTTYRVLHVCLCLFLFLIPELEFKVSQG